MWGEASDKPLVLKMFVADFVLGMPRKKHSDVDVTWMSSLREATGKDDIVLYHSILYLNDGQIDYAVQSDQERRWRKEDRSGGI